MNGEKSKTAEATSSEAEETKSQSTVSVAENKPGEENYSIYNYLKKTPAVLIALVSGIVAILSFIISYAEYIQISHVLTYWNVDPSAVSGSNKQLFYTFCFAIIFLLIHIIANILIIRTVSYFSPISEIRKRIKNQISKLKNKNAAPQNNAPTGDSGNPVNEPLKVLNEYQKRLKKCKIKFQESFNSVLYLTIIFILLFISTYAFYLTDFRSANDNMSLNAFLYSVVQFVLYYLTARLSRHFSVKSAIKQHPEQTNDFSIIETKLSKLESSTGPTTKHTIKSFFSNNTILVIIFNALIVIVLLFLLIFGAKTTPAKKFKSVDIDGVKYMAVYTNSETMVLEEAVINGNTVKILTNKQMIIPISGVKYEIVEFESVEKE